MGTLRGKAASSQRCCPVHVVKFPGERVANEILMHFRSQRKSSQDVSLSDYIETGTDGAPLQLMDVVSEDCDLLEQVCSQEMVLQLRQAMNRCLSEQERQVIVLRYGLNGQSAKRQREVADITGISRSYVSRIEKRALEKLRAEMER
ncbi:MAG TPA: sigma-70 family RNA polymerase sigma factor [Candidatus Faecousia faecavium]|nr:sigma-70 family RNA polymerase sigma factor [Candidatus Faecousia faecavium]